MHFKSEYTVSTYKFYKSIIQQKIRSKYICKFNHLVFHVYSEISYNALTVKLTNAKAYKSATARGWKLTAWKLSTFMMFIMSVEYISNNVCEQPSMQLRCLFTHTCSSLAKVFTKTQSENWRDWNIVSFREL